MGIEREEQKLDLIDDAYREWVRKEEEKAKQDAENPLEIEGALDEWNIPSQNPNRLRVVQ